MAEKQKVFVMMSGGVDSSVAAAILARDGKYEVVGAHMVCWKGETKPLAGSEVVVRGCSAEEDAEDARRVADKLGIPFYVFDLTAEYKAAVFDYMIREYEAGRTPNPDVMCNSEIKFGVFLEKALALGADTVATGHYVRIKQKLIFQTGDSSAPAAKDRLRSSRLDAARGDQAPAESESFSKSVSVLFSAADNNKDQSYFLWRLTQDQLSRALFPVGDMLKSEVRALARKLDLPTAEKKDSQGLCFVGQTDFAVLLREHLPIKKGKVVTMDGKIVGEHDGTHFYTIGQRHGIGVYGGGATYFVARKDAKNNELIVAEGENDPILYAKEIIASGVHWISGQAPASGARLSARVRYRQPLTPCVISQPDGLEGKIKASFQTPMRGVAPGQSIVFYEEDEMLGGAVIESAS